MKLKTVGVLMFLMGCLVSAQAITLEAIHKQFQSQPVVRAEFKQERKIKTVKQPLHSAGTVLVSREKGLLWQQKTPFAMTMILTDQKMMQTMTGQPAQILTAKTHPQLFQFNTLLRSLFQADPAQLAKNFKLSFTDLKKGRWQLVLVPKVSPLDKLFHRITLTGARQLESLDIDDRQGDQTIIRFYNHQLLPDTLTTDEQQRFIP